MVVGVGGPRLGGRQVRVEVEGGDVVLQQLSDPEGEIVVPENMAWTSLIDERNKASEGPFSNAGTRSSHWLRG